MAKWLSVHLRTKWLWVRIPLLSLKGDILLERLNNSFKYGKTPSEVMQEIYSKEMLDYMFAKDPLAFPHFQGRGFLDNKLNLIADRHKSDIFQEPDLWRTTRVTLFNLFSELARRSGVNGSGMAPISALDPMNLL